jgi:hypothetical protein
MPSLVNSQPPTPSAPSDMTIAECYIRLDEFLAKNANIKDFKIEDDNHGMGMISTLNGNAPKQAINVRLGQSNIRNYLLNNGFQCADNNTSICSRRS